MTPSVLLFELGGVLVENVGFERFNVLLQAPIPTEELKTRWLHQLPREPSKPAGVQRRLSLPKW